MFYQIVLLFHTIVAFLIIALVLVQQGKGATVGAAFGSGASQTVFGSRGSGSFLFKLTMGLGLFFFLTSLGLNYIATQSYKKQQIITLPTGQYDGKVAHPKDSVPQPTNQVDRVLPTIPGSPVNNNGEAK